MAAATNQTFQRFMDERVRVRAEQVRALVLAMEDDKRLIDDVYEAASAQSPTWTDQRTDGPPHLLTTDDLLAYNTFISNAITNLKGDAQYVVVGKACVRSPV